MKLEDILFKSSSHIVIVGRSGGGKTITTAKIIELLLKKGKLFILLDWANEYEIPGVNPEPPKFSFTLLKNSLPEIMSEIVRLQSPTSGTWTFDATARASLESQSFSEFLQRLKEDSEFPVRDAGAKAAYTRLLMLNRFFTEQNSNVLQKHVVFSGDYFETTTAQMAITFYLVQLYNTIIKKKLTNVFIIIEEALNIPERLLIKLLTQLRGYGVRIILTTQEFREWFLAYNLVLHDLGNNIKLIREYGVPPEYNKLKVGEAMLWWIEKHRWRKVKIKQSKLVFVRPKSEPINASNNISNTSNSILEEEKVITEQIEEIFNNSMEPKEEEIEKEDKEKHIKEFETNKEEGNEESENKNTSDRVTPRDPLYQRILEEHRVLSNEVNNIRNEISELKAWIENKIKDLSETLKNLSEASKEITNEKLREIEELQEKIIDLEYRVLSFTSSIAELNEKVQGIQRVIESFSISELTEKLNEIATKKIITEIEKKVKEIVEKKIEELDEKIEKKYRQYRKKEPEEIEIEIAENDTVESLIKRGILIREYQGRYELVRPTKYLGKEAFKKLANICKKEKYVATRYNGKLVFARELGPYD